jgi:CubicO group peptidase (beta-lactamase class C family)
MDSAEINFYKGQLAGYFDTLLNQAGFSGGIIVVKNGLVLYEHYQGFADEALAEPIHEHTPFHVASTSKTFTSTAILQLVRAGRMSLDDSLQRFFPLFPYPGITVRNLLNHSSGLPNYANLFPRYKWSTKKQATNTDVLHLFYANRPRLDFPTGTRFTYCNTNFALLALIVEKVSGSYFPDYIRDSIFAPSGMLDSYVYGTGSVSAFMPSWNGSKKPYAFNYIDAIYGDKNVFSTCRDLVKYDSAITHNLLLSQEWYDTAWTPNYPDKKYRDTIEHYGLGWRLKVFNDSLKIPYHNGWWHGNNAVFQRLIADSALIVVIGNRQFNRIYASAKAANIFRRYYTDMQDEQEMESGQPGGSRPPAIADPAVSSGTNGGNSYRQKQ